MIISFGMIFTPIICIATNLTWLFTGVLFIIYGIILLKKGYRVIFIDKKKN